jgi:hypothetical protein
VGTFYTNFAFYEILPESIEKILLTLNRDAYISPMLGKFVLIYEKLSEIQENDLIANLSLTLNCSALSATVDDDVYGFCYELYSKGNLIDKYISRTSKSRNLSKRDLPEGGNSDKLCSAFHIKNMSNSVEKILRMPSKNSKYTTNQDRHIDLAKKLGIDPFWAAGVGGYSYIKNGNITQLSKKDPSLRETLSLLRKVRSK